MMRWEYMMLEQSSVGGKFIPDHYGREGWELVGVVRATETVDRMWFKRPIVPAPSPKSLKALVLGVMGDRAWRAEALQVELRRKRGLATMNTTLAKLAQAGFLERVDRGLYRRRSPHPLPREEK